MATATITDWHDCYEDGWHGMITPEAFSHPAKFSYSLICRIVRHGLDQGYWKPGDTVGDPFGGVATGGIVCGYHNLNWRGVELEPRFVELGNKNLAMHAPRWAALETSPDVRLLQGDSRMFAEVVGQVAGVVSSPPYADSDTKPTKLGVGKGTRADGDSAGRNKGDYIYGDTPGQIGNDKGETYWQAMSQVYASMRDAMKPGGVAAIVVKDYVAKGARVPLCDQTCTLLESLGFDVFERCRCWLVKETREPSLFGGEHVKTKARKSFFRRLAESKGSPAIDWEEVIWCMKEEENPCTTPENP